MSAVEDALLANTEKKKRKRNRAPKKAAQVAPAVENDVQGELWCAFWY